MSKDNAEAKYRQISSLLDYNLTLLPEGSFVDLDETFDKSRKIPKEVGGTAGIIVPRAGTEEWYMIKKSGKENKPEGKGKKRPLNLSGMIWESFSEKCASVLFDILKQRENYLPNFLLVRSNFSDKFENRLRRETGVSKFYIASEIIGDPKEANNEKKYKDNHELFDKDPNLKELRDDICENAVIMFLISNYDLKLDNFIRQENSMIPIDFGNARFEEKSSPDIISGIDLMRLHGDSGKSSSGRFASKKLQEAFSNGPRFERTQKFYRQNLRAKDFLKVIHRIKSDQLEIESKLRDAAIKYTFGTQEEKEEYADVIVARVRNLLDLQPVFEKIDEDEITRSEKISSPKKEKSTKRNAFSQLSLRDNLIASDYFKERMLSSEEDSQAKIFFRSLVGIFDLMNVEESKIILALEGYIGEENSELKKSKGENLLLIVKDFNSFLNQSELEIKAGLASLSLSYQDSEYISGENKLDDSKSWQEQSDEISQTLDEFFGILKKPLIAEVKEYKKRTSDSDEETSEKEMSFDDDSNFKFGKIKSAEQVDIEWDLTRADEYLEGSKQMLGYTQKVFNDIEENTLSVLTHLDAHDTLILVREEYKKSKNPSTAIISTSNSSLKPAAVAAIGDIE